MRNGACWLGIALERKAWRLASSYFTFNRSYTQAKCRRDSLNSALFPRYYVPTFMEMRWQMRSVCKSGCEARRSFSYVPPPLYWRPGRAPEIPPAARLARQKAGQTLSVCRILSEDTIHALTYGFDMLGMSHYLRLGLPDLLPSQGSPSSWTRSLLSSILPGRRALCRWE